MYKNLNIIFAVLLLLFISISSESIPAFLNQLNSIDIEDKKPPKQKRHEDLWRQLYSMQEDPVLKRIPHEEKVKVLRNLSAYNAISKTSTSLEWTEMGPNKIGGRTRAILVDPNDSTNKTVFAAGVSGGLWKTNDITVTTPTWTEVWPEMENINITCIAADPTDSQILYVGTGEFAGSAAFGNGVYKSANGGATWTLLSYTFPVIVSDLVVRNESGNGVLYVGGGHTYDGLLAQEWSSQVESKTGGIYRSTDQGSNFTRVSTAFPSSGAHLNINNFDIDSNGRIWAGTNRNRYSGLDSYNGRLYYSDDGTSWTNVNWKPGATAYRTIVAVSPSNKDVIYLAAEGSDREIGYLMKSTNGGSSWTEMTIPPEQVEATGTHYGRNDQAGYSMHIKVDPNDPNTLIFGMITQYKSTDGGANWSEISAWYNTNSKPYVHADQHNLIYIDSNKILSANDGGVFYSADGGTNWSSKIEGYNVGQFYHADIHPTKNEYALGGTQDNGTWLVSTGDGFDKEVTGGDGAFSHISSVDPSIQFSQIYYNKIYKTTNEWSNSAYLINDDDTGAFISCSDYDSANDDYYITGKAGGELRILRDASVSDYPDSPSSGIFLNTSLTAAATAITVSPYADNIVIGDNEGNLVKITGISTATSTTFGEIDLDPSNALPPSAYLRSIEFGADENHILVVFSNYGTQNIWQTTNNGTNWTNLDGDLPNIPVGWGVFNPNNRNEVIIGTEVGIWSSDNVNAGSVQWSVNSGTIPNVPVHAISIRPNGAMVAATHGRGLWFSNSLVSGGGTSYPAATFTISDLDQTYLRSTTEVTITPDFSAVTNFTVDKYYVAIGTGTAAASINDVLDWTEVTASGGKLDLTSLSLSDYTSYSISLKGKDANDNYNAVKTEQFNTYKSLLGDSDNDWDIDQTDLNAFVNNWENSGSDIGPATGTAPYMAPAFDQVRDIYDVNVFSRNWVWSGANRTIEKIKQSGLTPLIDDLNIIKFGDTITIEIPEGITSGRIQIQKPNKNTEFKVLNNLSGMLVLENDGDFYQLAFGNLAKINGVITLEVSDVINNLNLAYEVYNKTGSIENNEIIISDPTENKLYQNYPNPFNNQTTIKYDLAEDTFVLINVFNSIGELVKVIDVGDQTPGQYVILWDGTNDENESVSNGIYFYQLRTKNYNKTKKMTLVK